MIFGSTVKKGLAGNDIDLLIVSNEFEDILRQDRKKMFNLPKELKFDLFLFTLKEFEKFKNSNSPLVESIECDSIELKVL
jgi:predicted nucleotidyltransferase